MELFMDADEDIWEADPDVGLKCLTSSGSYVKDMDELIRKYGPVHELEKGQLAKPSVMSDGTKVVVDVGVWSTAQGTVLRYDADKQFYEVIVIFPRDQVAKDDRFA